jgi:iron complex outermembrane recepter protein
MVGTALVLFAAALPASAQPAAQLATIAGEVVDPTGQLIAGAVVVLESTAGVRRETTATARGAFRFDAVVPGEHRITATSSGFAATTVAVSVDAGTQRTMTVALELDALTAQITVLAPNPRGYQAPRAAAATRLNVPIIDTPVSVQVVPRRVIDDQAALGLENIYTNVSGVTQSGNTLNAQTEIRPMIRGFETAVPLRNGLRATTVGAVDPVNVESVEILKGPASILYGTLEPGGVVNYVTKKPLMARQFEVTQQLGSNDQLRTTVDATGPLNAGRTLAYRAVAAFEDADSFRDSVHLRRFAFVPSISFRPSERTELFADFSYSNKVMPYDSGVPFGANGQPLVAPSTFFGDPALGGRDLTDGFTSLGLFRRLSTSTLLRTQFQFHRVHALNESIRNRGMGGVPGAELLRRRYQNEDRTDDDYQFVGDILSTVTLGPTKHDVLVGADLAYQDSDFRRFRSNIPDIPVTGNSLGFVRPAVQPLEVILGTNRWAAAYVQDQMSVGAAGRLKVLIGARYDTSAGEGTRNAVAQQPSEDSSVTGRFGAGYKLTGAMLAYASVSQSFVPQVPGTVDIDGVLLHPQTGLQYETGLKAEAFGGRLLATASLYQIRKDNVALSDLVLFNQTGQIAFFPGVAERSRGVELDAAGRVSERVSVFANYSFNDAETVEHVNTPAQVGQPLGNTPQHLSRLWIAYDGSDGGSARGFGGGAGVRAQSPQAMQFDTLRLDGFSVADLALWYRLRLEGGRVLRLQFNADNVLDREYYVRASDRSIVHPGAPRTARMTVGVEF